MDVPAHYLDETEAGANPELISGRVLIFNDSEADNRLLKHYMRETRVQFSEADTLGAALDWVRSDPFDIVICGEQANGIPFERIEASLGEAGYSSSFIVVTSDILMQNTSSDTPSARHYLIKPLDEFRVFDTFEGILGISEVGNASDQIQSTLPDDVSNLELVEWYIDHVKRVVHTLQKAMMADAVDDARNCLSMLRDTASSYGFAPISEHATKLLTAINASGSVLECQKQVNQYIKMTRRIRVM